MGSSTHLRGGAAVESPRLELGGQVRERLDDALVVARAQHGYVVAHGRVYERRLGAAGRQRRGRHGRVPAVQLPVDEPDDARARRLRHRRHLARLLLAQAAVRERRLQVGPRLSLHDQEPAVARDVHVAHVQSAPRHARLAELCAEFIKDKIFAAVGVHHHRRDACLLHQPPRSPS